MRLRDRGRESFRTLILAFFVSFFAVYLGIIFLSGDATEKSALLDVTNAKPNSFIPKTSSIVGSPSVLPKKKVQNFANLPSFCPLMAATYRGVLDPATIKDSLGLLDLSPPTLPLFPHAIPDANCPKYIFVDQNHDAGAGHRIRQWSTALWLAMSLPSGSAAFLHTTLDEGKGKHGGYPGMDELLGLALGEGKLRANEPGCCDAGLEPWLAKMGLSRVPLERASVSAYASNDHALSMWKARVQQSKECNVAYSVPMDQWVVDHGTPTRNASVWKFAMAEALSRRERQSGGIAASSQQPRALRPPSQWPSNAIHVGVHFRVNDGLLVSDSDLANVLYKVVLPALSTSLAATSSPLAMATQVYVHVFSESENPSVDAPLLTSLDGSPLAQDGPLAENHIKLFHYGPNYSPLDTIWLLAQTDIFVGCVSSLSWIVAQFSSRPFPLMQKWGNDYAWCVFGSLCCSGGACEEGETHRRPLMETTSRLANMAACGLLNDESW